MNKNQIDYLDSFIQHVKTQPSAIAVEYEMTQVTYQDLAGRAAEIQAILSNHAITAGMPVAVMMRRTPDMLATLLAIHSLGAYFIQLDENYPQNRLEHYVQIAEPAIIVADDCTASRAAGFGPRVVRMPSTSHRKATFGFAEAANEGLLAYVLFTSGSTGLPKGVEIRRSSMSSLLQAMGDRICFTKDHAMLSHTTVAFDMSIPELFLAFSRGGRVVLANSEEAGNPTDLSRLLDRSDVAQATPTMWRILLDSETRGWPHLTAISGAENLSTRLATRLLENVKILWNFYGPTESTVWVTSALIDETTVPAPLGEPLEGVRIAVQPTEMDTAEKVHADDPTVTIGELVVLGDFVANGYHRDPETTSRFFGYDSERKARYYRTGDIVRQTSTGALYWLGRGDDQVKVRGNRIDVGEVIRQLELHPDVSMAHVTTKTREDTDDLLLVAYVQTLRPVTRDELDQWISGVLPNYMVPSYYVAIESPPLLPNGKLDPQSLPAPDRSNTLRSNTMSLVAASNKKEKDSPVRDLVLKTLRQLLHDDEVSEDDVFIELGGSSATAFIGASMMTRRLGVQVAPDWLLKPITIREVVKRIEKMEE